MGNSCCFDPKNQTNPNIKNDFNRYKHKDIQFYNNNKKTDYEHPNNNDISPTNNQ